MNCSEDVTEKSPFDGIKIKSEPDDSDESQIHLNFIDVGIKTEKPSIDEVGVGPQNKSELDPDNLEDSENPLNFISVQIKSEKNFYDKSPHPENSFDVNSSDDDVDELECDELYDSTEDVEYVPQLESESDSDSDSLQHRHMKAKGKHGRPNNYLCPPSHSYAATPASTASSVATTSVVSPAPRPSVSSDPVSSVSSAVLPNPTTTNVATPVDRCGRRSACGEDDADSIVNFSSATQKSRCGYVWKTRPQVSVRTRTLAKNIVTDITPGPTQEAANADSIEKCFSLFVSDEIVTEIVEWTNQKIDGFSLNFKKKTATVQRTTAIEIRALLGVLIFSGYRRDNHLSTKQMWSPVTGAAFYRAAMSVGRFSFLIACLRFDNIITRTERRATDKLAPIRSVWDKFIGSCQKHYTPNETLTVDEQLLAFRGRCPFRMFIPDKPAKYGLKLVLANDVQSKYLLTGIPYLGKEGPRLNDEKNLAHTLTLALTRPYHHTNRNVTTDNWFTSVPLIEDLWLNCGMTLVGTVRGNKREIPDVMKDKSNRIQGSSTFLFTRDITFVSYVPNTAVKKTVLLMSSMHTQPSLSENGKPEIIQFYNKTKGAVDTFDQMCAQYSCSRKTKRWPLCLFYGILNAAVINSWIIHQDNMCRDGKTPLKRKCFMEELALQLIKANAEIRLNVPTQHRQVKTTISQVCHLNPTFVGGAAGLPAGESEEKMVRCCKCTYKTAKKTRFRCHQCKKPVCPAHYYATCNDCV